MTTLSRDQVRLSRRISMVLRHRPESAGPDFGPERLGGLPPATPPPMLFHGTPAANIESIMRDGLRPRSRHHVHLSLDVSTAVRVGRRRSNDVAVLRVAAAEMDAAGHTFHRSDNGVWLTSQIPPEYLSPDR